MLCLGRQRPTLVLLVILSVARTLAEDLTQYRWPQSTVAPSVHGYDAIRAVKASGKIQLNLDPYKYRSASQGPVMQDELAGRPVNVDDMREIDQVIDKFTMTYGWDPIIPQYSGRRAWAWSQWQGTIVERLARTFAIACVVPLLLILGVHLIDPSVRWFGTPEESHRLIVPLLAASALGSQTQ